MGNNTSAEANRKPLPQPPALQRHYSSPLPPPSFSISAPVIPSVPPLPPAPLSQPNKLSKPQTRRRSTAGLFRNASARSSSRYPERHSTGPGYPAPLFSSARSTASSNECEFEHPHSSLPSPISPGLASSVFTFEEAVGVVAGHRASGYWAPMTSDYPVQDLDLDLELLQEQQVRQEQFHQRQRQNKLGLQQASILSQKAQDSSGQEVLSGDASGQPSGLPIEPLNHHLNHYPSQHKRQSTRQDTTQRTSQEAYEEDDISPSGRATLQKQKPKRPSLLRSLSLRRPAEIEKTRPYQRRNSIGPSNPYTGDWHAWYRDSKMYDQNSGYHGGQHTDEWPPKAGSRTSWNYNFSSYEAKRLLNMVDDGSSPFENGLDKGSAVSETRASAVSGLTWKSSHPSQDGVGLLSHADSSLSLYAPIRRRSMAQIPGVATRRESTCDSLAGSALDFSAKGGKKVRHSLPATPNLSRHASFESGGSRPFSTSPVPPVPPLPPLHLLTQTLEKSEPGPRVTTPTDGDYPVTGAFKLGSLRITNGVASPMSSTGMSFSGSESGDDDEEPASTSHEVIDSQSRTQALADLSAKFQERLQETIYEKILKKQEAKRNAEALADKTDPLPSPGVAKQSSPSTLSPPSPLPPLATESSQKTPLDSAPALSTRTELPQIELAEGLFSEFELSSFSFSAQESTVRRIPSSRGLQATSKNTAVEDQLFEQECSSPPFARDEVLDVRLDSNAKRGPSQVLEKKKSAHSMHSVARTDSGFVSTPTSETSQKPLSKADSGYSSNVSLRSFKHAASKLMAPTKVASMLALDKHTTAASSSSSKRESFYIDELKLPSPTIHSDHDGLLSPPTASSSPRLNDPPPLPSLPSPRALEGLQLSLPEPKSSPPVLHTPTPPLPAVSSPPPPPVPPKDKPVASSSSGPKTTSPIVSPGITGGASNMQLLGPVMKRHTMPIALECIQTAPAASNSPNPDVTSPTPLTPASAGSDGSFSALSIGSGTQRPNKLRRFFNLGAVIQNMGPPTVHPTHIEEKADVPSVPREVREKLHEHDGLFPITTKRLALRAQLSKDTLKTIFSVGSLETHTTADSSVTSAATTTDLGPHGHGIQMEQPNLNLHRQFHTVSSLAHLAGAAKPSRKITPKRSWLGRSRISSDGNEEAIRGKMDKHEESGINWLSRDRTSRDVAKDETAVSLPVQIFDDEAKLPIYKRRNSKTNGTDGLAIAAANKDQHVQQQKVSESVMSHVTSHPNRMSLVAQLEHGFGMRRPFGKLTRPSTASTTNTSIATGDSLDYPTALTTALRPPPSPSLPSPIFAEMLEQQRLGLSAEKMTAETVPASARPHLRRPNALRMPPPLRTRSVTSADSDSNLRTSHPASREKLKHRASMVSLTSMASSSSMSSTCEQYRTLAQQTGDEVHVDGTSATVVASPSIFNSSLLGDDAGREDSVSRFSRRRFSRQHTRSKSLVSSRSCPTGEIQSDSALSSQALVKETQAWTSQSGPPPSMLRHRASFDGYSNGQRWGCVAGGSPSVSRQYNPPTMSNGYQDPRANAHAHQRHDSSGGSSNRSSESSSSGNSFQQQQQQAWNQYYQQYARPPPNVSRGYQNRNQSMNQRLSPQAPYRILHSYNSPAYRGAPIWG